MTTIQPRIIKRIAIMAAAVLVMAGCYKKKDTIAQVKVVLPSGSPIPGATVKLYGKPTIDATKRGALSVNESKRTDGNGEATFDFTDKYQAGQAGYAILNVTVYRVLPPNDTVKTEGVINVVDQQTTTKTFTLDH